MSSKRKIWIALLGTVVILALMAGGVVAGWLIYQKKRNDGWLRDALVAYESQQWERAKGLFERYIPQEPKNEELLLKYADTCKRMQKDRAGSLQGAATAYVQILTHYPDNDKVRHELIDVYAKLGVWSTLRYYTAEWLIRDPNDQYVRYYHALALDRMGLRDEAIAAYESLVNEKTDRSDVYGSYARLLREKGLESRAMEVFIKAREERPNDGHIVVDQARFLARTSTWTEVQHLLDEGLAMSPEDSDVLVAVAQAAMLRRQHAHAVELLRKAVKIKPDEGPAYLMLSSALSYQGLLEEAIKELKQVDPLVQVDTPMMLITLADLQLGIAAFDDAKLTIAQYNEAYPDQLPINEYFAAKELLVRGEPSAAVKRLASVIELRPGFTPAQYTLAEAYLATGEPELARNALESYLAKNTADERAQRLMAQRFGRPASIESIAARTEDMLQTKEADPQRMTLLAAALLDTAVRSDAVDQHASLIERTLRRVLESAPDSVDAYRILADLALWRKNPDAAEKVIADALENGVAESEFAMLRAAVALVRNDVTTFESLLANAKANKTLDRASYAVWAGFFAQHGFYDNAIALLEQGIAGLEKGEARASLEVERAIMALRHGETEKSAAWLTESDGSVATGTTLRRRFNAARLLLAQTYLISTDSQEMEQEANRLVNAVRTEDPGNAMLQVVDGLMLMRKRPPALEEAEVLFERAVAADSGNLGAQWGLARVALARSDFPRALMYIERALGLAPQMPTLQMLQAEALFQTDRLYEAERVIGRILKQRPNDPVANQLLAEVLIRKGDNSGAERALAALRSSAGEDPRFAESIQTLESSLLVRRGNSAEAEASLRALLQLRPDDIVATCNLASVLVENGRVDEAKTMLLEFADKRSGDPETWVTIARWWERTSVEGNLRESSTALTRALLADPSYVPAIRSMLAIRLRQGDMLEALGLCNRYLLRNPDDADMLNTKARLLSQWNSRLKEALVAADRAIELDDRPDFKGNRGVILVGMKLYDRALRDLLSAAAVGADLDARTDAALAEAYFATNDLASARKYLDTALLKAQKGQVVDAERLRQLQQALQQKEAAA